MFDLHNLIITEMFNNGTFYQHLYLSNHFIVDQHIFYNNQNDFYFLSTGLTLNKIDQTSEYNFFRIHDVTWCPLDDSLNNSLIISDGLNNGGAFKGYIYAKNKNPWFIRDFRFHFIYNKSGLYSDLFFKGAKEFINRHFLDLSVVPWELDTSQKQLERIFENTLIDVFDDIFFDKLLKNDEPFSIIRQMDLYLNIYFSDDNFNKNLSINSINFGAYKSNVFLKWAYNFDSGEVVKFINNLENRELFYGEYYVQKLVKLVTPINDFLGSFVDFMKVNLKWGWLGSLYYDQIHDREMFNLIQYHPVNLRFIKFHEFSLVYDKFAQDLHMAYNASLDNTAIWILCRGYYQMLEWGTQISNNLLSTIRDESDVYWWTDIYSDLGKYVRHNLYLDMWNKFIPAYNIETYNFWKWFLEKDWYDIGEYSITNRNYNIYNKDISYKYYNNKGINLEEFNKYIKRALNIDIYAYQIDDLVFESILFEIDLGIEDYLTFEIEKNLENENLLEFEKVIELERIKRKEAIDLERIQKIEEIQMKKLKEAEKLGLEIFYYEELYNNLEILNWLNIDVWDFSWSNFSNIYKYIRYSNIPDLFWFDKFDVITNFESIDYDFNAEINIIKFILSYNINIYILWVYDLNALFDYHFGENIGSIDESDDPIESIDDISNNNNIESIDNNISNNNIDLIDRSDYIEDYIDFDKYDFDNPDIIFNVSDYNQVYYDYYIYYLNFLFYDNNIDGFYLLDDTLNDNTIFSYENFNIFKHDNINSFFLLNNILNLLDKQELIINDLNNIFNHICFNTLYTDLDFFKINEVMYCKDFNKEFEGTIKINKEEYFFEENDWIVPADDRYDYTYYANNNFSTYYYMLYAPFAIKGWPTTFTNMLMWYTILLNKDYTGRGLIADSNSIAFDLSIDSVARRYKLFIEDPFDLNNKNQWIKLHNNKGNVYYFNFIPYICNYIYSSFYEFYPLDMIFHDSTYLDQSDILFPDLSRKIIKENALFDLIISNNEISDKLKRYSFNDICENIDKFLFEEEYVLDSVLYNENIKKIEKFDWFYKFKWENFNLIDRISEYFDYKYYFISNFEAEPALVLNEIYYQFFYYYWNVFKLWPEEEFLFEDILKDLNTNIDNNYRFIDTMLDKNIFKPYSPRFNKDDINNNFYSLFLNESLILFGLFYDYYNLKIEDLNYIFIENIVEDTFLIDIDISILNEFKILDLIFNTIYFYNDLNKDEFKFIDSLNEIEIISEGLLKTFINIFFLNIIKYDFILHYSNDLFFKSYFMFDDICSTILNMLTIELIHDSSISAYNYKSDYKFDYLFWDILYDMNQIILDNTLFNIVKFGYTLDHNYKLTYQRDFVFKDVLYDMIKSFFFLLTVDLVKFNYVSTFDYNSTYKWEYLLGDVLEDLNQIFLDFSFIKFINYNYNINYLNKSDFAMFDITDVTKAFSHILAKDYDNILFHNAPYYKNTKILDAFRCYDMIFYSSNSSKTISEFDFTETLINILINEDRMRVAWLFTNEYDRNMELFEEYRKDAAYGDEAGYRYYDYFIAIENTGDGYLRGYKDMFIPEIFDPSTRETNSFKSTYAYAKKAIDIHTYPRLKFGFIYDNLMTIYDNFFNDRMYYIIRNSKSQYFSREMIEPYVETGNFVFKNKYRSTMYLIMIFNIHDCVFYIAQFLGINEIFFIFTSNKFLLYYDWLIIINNNVLLFIIIITFLCYGSFFILFMPILTQFIIFINWINEEESNYFIIRCVKKIINFFLWILESSYIEKNFFIFVGKKLRKSYKILNWVLQNRIKSFFWRRFRKYKHFSLLFQQYYFKRVIISTFFKYYDYINIIRHIFSFYYSIINIIIFLLKQIYLYILDLFVYIYKYNKYIYLYVYYILSINYIIYYKIVSLIDFIRFEFYLFRTSINLLHSITLIPIYEFFSSRTLYHNNINVLKYNEGFHYFDYLKNKHKNIFFLNIFAVKKNIYFFFKKFILIFLKIFILFINSKLKYLKNILILKYNYILYLYLYFINIYRDYIKINILYVLIFILILYTNYYFISFLLIYLIINYFIIFLLIFNKVFYFIGYILCIIYDTIINIIIYIIKFFIFLILKFKWILLLLLIYILGLDISIIIHLFYYMSLSIIYPLFHYIYLFMYDFDNVFSTLWYKIYIDNPYSTIQYPWIYECCIDIYRIEMDLLLYKLIVFGPDSDLLEEDLWTIVKTLIKEYSYLFYRYLNKFIWFLLTHTPIVWIKQLWSYISEELIIHSIICIILFIRMVKYILIAFYYMVYFYLFAPWLFIIHGCNTYYEYLQLIFSFSVKLYWYLYFEILFTYWDTYILWVQENASDWYTSIIYMLYEYIFVFIYKYLGYNNYEKLKKIFFLILLYLYDIIKDILKNMYVFQNIFIFLFDNIRYILYNQFSFIKIIIYDLHYYFNININYLTLNFWMHDIYKYIYVNYLVEFQYRLDTIFTYYRFPRLEYLWKYYNLKGHYFANAKGFEIEMDEAELNAYRIEDERYFFYMKASLLDHMYHLGFNEKCYKNFLLKKMYIKNDWFYRNIDDIGWLPFKFLFFKFDPNLYDYSLIDFYSYQYLSSEKPNDKFIYDSYDHSSYECDDDYVFLDELYLHLNNDNNIISDNKYFYIQDLFNSYDIFTDSKTNEYIYCDYYPYNLWSYDTFIGSHDFGPCNIIDLYNDNYPYNDFALIIEDFLFIYDDFIFITEYYFHDFGWYTDWIEIKNNFYNNIKKGFLTTLNCFFMDNDYSNYLFKNELLENFFWEKAQIFFKNLLQNIWIKSDNDYIDIFNNISYNPKKSYNFSKGISYYFKDWNYFGIHDIFNIPSYFKPYLWHWLDEDLINQSKGYKIYLDSSYDTYFYRISPIHVVGFMDEYFNPYKVELQSKEIKSVDRYMDAWGLSSLTIWDYYFTDTIFLITSQNLGDYYDIGYGKHIYGEDVYNTSEAYYRVYTEHKDIYIDHPIENHMYMVDKNKKLMHFEAEELHSENNFWLNQLVRGGLTPTGPLNWLFHTDIDSYLKYQTDLTMRENIYNIDYIDNVDCNNYIYQWYLRWLKFFPHSEIVKLGIYIDNNSFNLNDWFVYENYYFIDYLIEFLNWHKDYFEDEAKFVMYNSFEDMYGRCIDEYYYFTFIDTLSFFMKKIDNIEHDYVLWEWMDWRNVRTFAGLYHHIFFELLATRDLKLDQIFFGLNLKNIFYQPIGDDIITVDNGEFYDEYYEDFFDFNEEIGYLWDWYLIDPFDIDPLMKKKFWKILRRTDYSLFIKSIIFEKLFLFWNVLLWDDKLINPRLYQDISDLSYNIFDNYRFATRFRNWYWDFYKDIPFKPLGWIFLDFLEREKIIFSFYKNLNYDFYNQIDNDKGAYIYDDSLSYDKPIDNYDIIVNIFDMHCNNYRESSYLIIILYIYIYFFFFFLLKLNKKNNINNLLNYNCEYIWNENKAKLKLSKKLKIKFVKRFEKFMKKFKNKKLKRFQIIASLLSYDNIKKNIYFFYSYNNAIVNIKSKLEYKLMYFYKIIVKFYLNNLLTRIRRRNIYYDIEKRLRRYRRINKHNKSYYYVRRYVRMKKKIDRYTKFIKIFKYIKNLKRMIKRRYRLINFNFFNKFGKYITSKYILYNFKLKLSKNQTSFKNVYINYNYDYKYILEILNKIFNFTDSSFKIFKNNKYINYIWSNYAWLLQLAYEIKYRSIKYIDTETIDLEHKDKNKSEFSKDEWKYDEFLKYKKNMYYILNYFTYLDKYFFNNKGPNWLLHKNSHTVFLTADYSSNKELIYYNNQQPYILEFFFTVIFIYLYLKPLLYLDVYQFDDYKYVNEIYAFINMLIELLFNEYISAFYDKIVIIDNFIKNFSKSSKIDQKDIDALDQVGSSILLKLNKFNLLTKYYNLFDHKCNFSNYKDCFMSHDIYIIYWFRKIMLFFFFIIFLMYNSKFINVWFFSKYKNIYKIRRIRNVTNLKRYKREFSTFHWILFIYNTIKIKSNAYNNISLKEFFNKLKWK